MMEHNSNFVPWYALCREILPRFGRRVECRVARFDHATGELDLDHLASLVDDRTKLVCCHRRVELPRHQAAAGRRPTDRRRAAATGSRRGDAARCCWSTRAQLVPTSAVDVQALDVDYLAFSFHKMLAPFGVGVLYAKEHLLRAVAARSCTAAT